jgi:hypothetical protein
MREAIALHLRSARLSALTSDPCPRLPRSPSFNREFTEWRSRAPSFPPLRVATEHRPRTPSQAHTLHWARRGPAPCHLHILLAHGDPMCPFKQNSLKPLTACYGATAHGAPCRGHGHHKHCVRRGLGRAGLRCGEWAGGGGWRLVEAHDPGGGALAELGSSFAASEGCLGLEGRSRVSWFAVCLAAFGGIAKRAGATMFLSNRRPCDSNIGTSSVPSNGGLFDH